MLFFRYPIDEESIRRASRLPDLPMTRFEYIEAMAFAKEDPDGRV